MYLFFKKNSKRLVSKEVMLDSICVTVFENVCFVDIAQLNDFCNLVNNQK